MKCRRLIDSPLYQERWGHRYHLTSDQNTKTRFDNNKGGSRLATSVGGALTGEGGDIILIDDPHNVVEAESETVRHATLQWWDEAMSTRLNNPNTGAYVIIMQRVHEQDLAGHVIDRDDDDEMAQAMGQWTHLCLPARYEHDHPSVSDHDPRTEDGALLWPDRFGENAVRELENILGSYGAAGQLQQRPAPREGGMFDPSWWEIVKAAPAGGNVVRGWDLAASEEIGSSWTSGGRMRRVDGVYYIEDIVRIRATPEKVERKMKATAAKDVRECGPRVVIDYPQDPGQAGKMQARYLARQLAGFIIRYSPETGSKPDRAQAMSAQSEAGNVKLVDGPWIDDFIREAQVFPNSDFTDQIDCLSRAFHRLTPMKRARGMTAPRLIESQA